MAKVSSLLPSYLRTTSPGFHNRFSFWPSPPIRFILSLVFVLAGCSTIVLVYLDEIRSTHRRWISYWPSSEGIPSDTNSTPPVKPLIMFRPEEYDDVSPFPFSQLEDLPLPYVIHSNAVKTVSRTPWWTDPSYTLLKSFMAASNSYHTYRPPSCSLTSEHLKRYNSIINSTSQIYLALNLRNSENVSPS